MFGDLMRYLGFSSGGGGMAAANPMVEKTAGMTGSGSRTASSSGGGNTALSPQMMAMLMQYLNPPQEPIRYAPAGTPMRPTAFNYTPPAPAQAPVYKPLGS